ncbi:hypothetical protein SAMN05216328_11910 [Ensifer sp. YR511]|nr:hypothetical protein SAMN05216328_11910 [Ensifer sp. YR511]
MGRRGTHFEVAQLWTIKGKTGRLVSLPVCARVTKLSFYHHADCHGLSHAAVSKRSGFIVPPILVSAILQGAFCK